MLGAHLLKQGFDENRKLAGIVGRYQFQMEGADIYQTDLMDFAATRRIVERVRPAVIVHCAAATNVDWCEKHAEAADEINVRASVFLAELAQEIGARFVYVSTDSVFDGTKGNYAESDAPSPRNVYARTKWMGEQEVLRVHPAALIARVNFYGWSLQSKPSLAEWILGRLSEGDRVPGFSDVYFCPLTVNDLATALLKMVDRGLAGIYHVVGAEKISKFEFARRVAQTFGFPPEQVVPISIAQATLQAERPRDTSLQVQKVTSALGYAMPDVDSGLRRFRALRGCDCVQGSETISAGAER